MSKSKTNNLSDDKEDPSVNSNNELFNDKTMKQDEIESDGSANAFDKTESVNEDNFDNLSEK